MKDIYFDNSSTSFPKAPNVGRAMGEFIENGAFNINRGSYEGAYEAGSAVLDTREMLKDLFNCPNSKNVVFTPSVTYSLNFFIKGFLKPGDHVLVTSVEHNAVMRPLVQMEKLGVEFDAVPCDEEGGVTADDFRAYIKENTKAIITTHASNVCGTLVDIKSVSDIAKSHNILYLVDASQTAGVYNIDLKEISADMLAAPGHKGLLGPQGTGILYIREGLNLNILKEGGTGSKSEDLFQPELIPDKYESGTHNTPGIVGLNEGVKFIFKEGINKIKEHEEELCRYMLERLEEIPNIKIYGPKDATKRAAVITINIGNMDSGEITFLLDSEYDIATRSGIHCAPLAHKTLGTLEQGAVRFSIGYFNTKEEIDKAIEALKEISKNN